MQEETITRLRNAFAQTAIDWLTAKTSLSRGAGSPLPFSSMTETDWLQAVMLWRQHAPALLAECAGRSCPACGASSSRFLFLSYDLHPFHECETCGSWFEPRQVTVELFERFFAECPEAGELALKMTRARDGDAGRDADMARVGGYLDALRPLLPETAAPAYLDAGCGVGHSLRAAQARGFRAQGVEADRTAVAIARAAGLPVAEVSEPLQAGPYHLLSFWETLEHVSAPLEALQAYLPHLHDDGLVALTVPNLNALATRMLRESCAWVHGGYNTPGHINLFSPSSITRLLDRAGLSVLDVDGHYSANPIELSAYLTGESGGAFDTLAASPGGTLSEALSAALSGVWPGVTLLERLGLVSPILHVIACRRGRESRFAPAIAALRSSRERRIADQARALIAGEPDYKAMAAALQDEVTRRDELLRTTVATLEGEVNLRDREITLRDEMLAQTVTGMQSEITRRDDLLRSTTATMQVEIETRDTLLRWERERFARSISGRLQAAREKAARLLGGASSGLPR